MTQSQPQITGTTHTLPFHQLSPRDFERLCLWLVQREGFERAEHLGAAGREQGRDIVAWRGGERWAFQCKRVDHFYPNKAETEVDKVLGLPEDLRPGTLVFLVACDVSDETRQRARARCAGEMDCDFWPLTELDERVKRHPDILQEFFEAVQDEAAEPGWWRRFRRHPLVFYPTLAFTIVAAIVGLLAGLAEIGADIGPTGQQLQQLGLVRAFPPERGDETLIVIASFYHSEGIADTEVHREICRAIQTAQEDLGYSNLRVEVEPARVRADDRDGAEKLGNRYNASMVIWGADTGVRVTVNYLNLKHPGFEAAEVRISETERTQLANPSAYAEFITRDLPGQLTYLSLFAVGQSYYIEAAYADSLKAIQKAIDSLPPETQPPEGLAQAYFHLAWLHQEPMDDDEQAIADYDQAIALNPGFAEAYNNRGNAHAGQGDLEGAIADFDQAIALNPDHTLAYNNRGLVHANRGDLETAMADFSRAIAMDPDCVEAYNNRGIVHANRGNLEGAKADFSRAIALNTDNAEPYYNRGTACYDLGDLEGAIADFDHAITLNPGFAQAYVNRGRALYNMGDAEGAMADFDQAITLDPDFAASYYNRGIVHGGLGNMEAAIADFDHAIALNPGFAQAYTNRGNARRDLGDLEAAIADFDQAIALNPDYAPAYYNRGAVRVDLGNPECAIADFDHAITLNPAFVQAYWGRGVTHRQLGNAQAALADFRRYLELWPNADDHQLVEEWIVELEAQTSQP